MRNVEGAGMGHANCERRSMLRIFAARAKTEVSRRRRRCGCPRTPRCEALGPLRRAHAWQAGAWVGVGMRRGGKEFEGEGFGFFRKDWKLVFVALGQVFLGWADDATQHVLHIQAKSQHFCLCFAAAFSKEFLMQPNPC